MNNHNNEKWLEPLKNRPDLEPNPLFVHELKSSLINREQERSKKSMSFRRFKMLIPATLSILLFSILTVSFLASNEKGNQVNPGENGKETEVVEQGPENQDLDTLLSKYPSYKSIFTEVYEVTKAEEASKQVVHFFEALRVEDKDFLKQYGFFVANADKEVQVLLDFYRGLDVNLLKVEYIVASQAEPSFEIVFSYVQNNEEKMNHIHLNFVDESNFNIYAPLKEFDMKTNWRNAIHTKIVEIERKLEYGITKQEVMDRFGSNFEIVDAVGEGASSTWKYTYFVRDGYIEEGLVPEGKDLAEQNVGVVLIIGWSPDGKVQRMDMYFGREGSAYVKSVDENGISENELPTSGESIDDLELNDKEREAYKAFKQEHNPEVLKSMDPISIAKMYIQAGIDQDWETEYALYTTREDRVMWSKETHKEYFENENTTPDEIKEAFSGLGAGTFIQRSDYEGYISFVNKNGEQGFQMVKDENGVWKVSFMPIQ